MTFDSLVKYILNENPITDVQLDSELNPHLEVGRDGDNWYDNRYAIDFNLFRNKQYRERLQAETAKHIPFNIKLIFIDTKYPGYDHREEVKPTPGVITFITHPSGDPMVLSSKKRGVWMVGHKLGHAFSERSHTFFQGMVDTLEGLGVDMDADRDDLKDIFRDMSGFESAKQGTVISAYEYINELVAQYVMFGRVTFLVGRVFKTREIANSMSRKLTELIERTFSEYVGKVIWDEYN